MGQSLGTVGSLPRIEAPIPHVFQAHGLQYQVKETADGISHIERKLDKEGKTIWEREHSVAFVFGSGTRGRSYLVQEDGALFQSPISWFSQKQMWDLSPGYEKGNRHFQRPIAVDCLFCHVNRFDHVPGSINRYKGAVFHGQAVGCQRCHGPGELHVRPHSDFAKSVSIVNPAKLEPNLRDSVCDQCHLHGDAAVDRMGRQKTEFRPGMPLDLFITHFVDESVEPDQFLGQVQQMRASRCFSASQGKLGCISCHDPHFQPEPGEKTGFYRNRCQNCHEEGQRDCSVPIAQRTRENANSCHACHMPRYATSNIVHTSMTDHRVVRRPRPPDISKRVKYSGKLVPYSQSATSSGSVELARDLSVALIDQAATKGDKSLLPKALSSLRPALEKWPGDLVGLQAQELGNYLLGKPKEALETSQLILALWPEEEKSLENAALACLMLQEPAKARAYAERLVKLNPNFAEYQYALALAAFEDKKFEQAAKAARDTLRLLPSHKEARVLLIRSLVKSGSVAEAEEELAIQARIDNTSIGSLRHLLKK
jgi:hypothetical protein